MEVHVLSWMMDIFFIFTLHILYKQTLGVRFKNRFVLLLGWTGCFLAWNLCSYLFADSPLITGICSILINFITLNVLYIGSARVKIVLVFIVAVLGIIAETTVSFIYIILGINISLYEGNRNLLIYFGSAVSKILCFVFVKIISHITNKNNQVKINFTEWIEIFLVPVGSIIIFYIVVWDDFFDITVSKIIVFAVLLVINLLTYYIYQKIQSHAEELIDKEMLKQQNEYYRLRFEDTEKQWTKLRKIKHNMKNSYVLELSYLEEGEYEKLHEIYTSAIGELNEKSYVIESGNLGIDSILSYKLEIAREAGIAIEYDVRVPGKITMSNGDMNILFGNLMDNAIEAAAKLPEENRKLELKLHTDESAMIFSIANSFDGTVIRNKKGEIISMKADKENHGFGINAVKEIVSRHKGTINMESRGNTFKVTAFLYMDDLPQN